MLFCLFHWKDTTLSFLKMLFFIHACVLPVWTCYPHTCGEKQKNVIFEGVLTHSYISRMSLLVECFLLNAMLTFWLAVFPTYCFYTQIQIIEEVKVSLSQIFAVIIEGDEKDAIFLAYICFTVTVFTQDKKTLHMKVFSSFLILLRSLKTATDNCKLLKIYQSAMLNSSKPIRVTQPFRAVTQIPFKLHIETVSSVSSSSKCSQFNFISLFIFLSKHKSLDKQNFLE